MLEKREMLLSPCQAGLGSRLFLENTVVGCDIGRHVKRRETEHKQMKQRSGFLSVKQCNREEEVNFSLRLEELGWTVWW